MTSLRALPRYAFVLFALLCAATSFEGFDTKLANFLLPRLGSEFGVAADSLGNALSIIGLGTVAAFFVVRLADRVGRRPVLVGSLAGYGVLTLATFFAESLGLFTVLQFGARMLMVTQLAIAFIMLSEELPGDLRGRANAVMGAAASVGAALPALFLAPLEETALGWRGLFLLGALPILLVPIFVSRIRETRAFETRRREVAPASFLVQARVLFGPALRTRTLAVSGMWFTLNFWSVAVVYFFTYYVFEERGWTPADLQLVVPAAVPFVLVGYFVAGWLMDALGRRPAMVVYLVAGTAVAVACYQVEGWWAIAVCWVGIQTMQGVWTVQQTLTAELFPTEVRATANGLTHNLLGRLGLVLAPAVTGQLSVALDSTGNAVSLLALVNLCAIPIVLFAIPETRGIDLGGNASSAPA